MTEDNNKDYNTPDEIIKYLEFGDENKMSDHNKNLASIIEGFNESFNKKLEELKSESKDDLKFTILDLKGTEFDMIKNVTLLHKWSDKHSTQDQIVKRLESALERIYARLYAMCRREVTDVAMKGAKEIEGWICRQSKYAKAKMYLNDQTVILDYIKKTLESIKTRHYTLQNIVANRRYFDGG